MHASVTQKKQLGSLAGPGRLGFELGSERERCCDMPVGVLGDERSECVTKPNQIGRCHTGEGTFARPPVTRSTP
ncbi:Hypp7016 [Branchiostoma lanceolatum]|uniref:Hypp7016 protein n=1 Tax=Branchiostoma lanceolatum TaxID=7740 RepID=A0A8J9YWB8_BRALA|nr:Hypp7016 [Branchiostoma lanceolatum]